MKRKAVQFGAGNIGRGFTGQLFSESGFEVVFADVVPDLVKLLNEWRSGSNTPPATNDYVRRRPAGLSAE